jgi:hypothetical protein
MNAGILWENQNERDHFENLCADGRIILKSILQTQYEREHNQNYVTE